MHHPQPADPEFPDRRGESRRSQPLSLMDSRGDTLYYCCCWLPAPAERGLLGPPLSPPAAFLAATARAKDPDMSP